MSERDFYYPVEIAEYEKRLIERFIQSDQRHLDWITELIHPDEFIIAARVIKSKLQRQFDRDNRIPTTVIGLPSKGLHFQFALGLVLGMPVNGAHKGSAPPKQWMMPFVVEDGMKVYKNGRPAAFVIGGFSEEDTFLIVDDILGKGRVLIPTVKNMLKRGIKPYIATLATMLFEPGYNELCQLGIKPESIYYFERMNPDKTFVLGRDPMVPRPPEKITSP